jgi:hypothetical protein
MEEYLLEILRFLKWTSSEGTRRLKKQEQTKGKNFFSQTLLKQAKSVTVTEKLGVTWQVHKSKSGKLRHVQGQQF